jgi:hypothetical protein
MNQNFKGRSKKSPKMMNNKILKIKGLLILSFDFHFLEPPPFSFKIAICPQVQMRMMV